MAHVRAKYPENLLFAAGWSLGANILTRYVGEEGEATPLAAAAALCNPFNLVRATGWGQSIGGDWGRSVLLGVRACACARIRCSMDLGNRCLCWLLKGLRTFIHSSRCCFCAEAGRGGLAGLQAH